jgi:hypothetical protein
MSEYLNEKQKLAFDKIIRGENVCIIGKGGSGKSYICDLIKEDDVLFVSPTGMAALNLGPHARTIHSTLMLGSKSLKAFSWGNVAEYIDQNKHKLIEFFDKFKRIVFDEGSMIISGLFETYTRVFHTIYDTNLNILFNGKQIVMILDPLQLTPVKNTTDPYLDIANPTYKEKKLCRTDLIVECPEFKSLFNDNENIIHLTENMRCENPEWDEVLQGCRLGFKGYTEENKDKLLSELNSRRFTRKQINENEELKSIYDINLKTTLKKDTISEINNNKIQKLIDRGNKNHIIKREIVISKEDFYKKYIDYFDSEKNSNKLYDDSVNYMDDLSGYYAEREYEGKKMIGFNIDFPIVLGCRVMYRKNDKKIRNGSLGYINDFKLDENGDIETIDIKFDKHEETINIEKVLFEHPDWTDIKISAFPIIPAFAITIHKLQAQTIDSPLFILYDPRIIPYHSKKEHLLYTAISRCKRKEDIYIICDQPIDEYFFPVNIYMYKWYKSNCD